jgi:nucleotide-binding universal stress UspA family protein
LNLAPFSPINLLGLKAALRHEAAEKLEPLLHLARNTGVPAACLVEDGNQARAILKAAARLRADLIIMGARSRGFFANLFSRRIRDRVLNGAACPVMIVE